MAFKKGQSGNPAGKPKGAISKPRISDYLTQEDIDAIVLKAVKMAKAGNEKMIQLVIEQNFGKAAQMLVGDPERPISMTFDNSFQDAFTSKTAGNS